METIQNINFESNKQIKASSQDEINEKHQKILTNEHLQATQLKLCACNTIQIRTFHITWITFWLCFFVWFCTTNIYHEISQDIKDLTITQHQLAGSLSVTSTIFFRLIISHLCFKYGSKISYLVILICTILSLIMLALIESPIGYIICHILLGVSGASFVVTQYHTTRMFSDNIIGQTQAMTAGFGNVGGGCANFIMALLMNYTNISWRWWMIIFALILFLFCFIYYFGTRDIPQQVSKDISHSHSHSLIIDDIDIIGIKKQSKQSKHPPDKQIGGNLGDVVCDYRVWLLFFCYAACFGVEITFYLMAAQYFQSEYALNEIVSGLIVFVWSLINIFARPFGGYLSDKYNIIRRVNILFIVLFLQSVFIFLFGAIGDLSISLAIMSSLLFSICVNMAEGIIYNIVPFIGKTKQSIGHVIGIVGSGGNFGSMFFIFIIFMPWNSSGYDQQYSWIILAIIVMIISFLTLSIRFTEREIHDFDNAIKECYDLQLNT